jgi:putative transposase
LFIADGLPKLDEEIRKTFPRTDFQLCTIHASGNFETEVREMDKQQIDRELKRIFTSETKEDALLRLKEFKGKWDKKYPRPISTWRTRPTTCFTYYGYPQSIRRSIHSNNIIERMNKEIRRRIKIIDSLPTEDSALKIVYLRTAELNEKYSNRVMNGYFKCRDKLKSMFSSRYP